MFLDDRRVNAGRKFGQYGVDFVAHFLSRDIAVFFQSELNYDGGNAFIGIGAQIFDARNGVDRALDFVRNLGFNRFGRSARINRDDRNKRKFDFGKAIHAQSCEADRADHD